jgi:hypothetical protein
MSLLARYKKNEKTFMELVKLVEGSTDDKKETLLANVRQEDPSFAAKVESRMLNPEDIKALGENIMAEIVSVCAPKVLATCLVLEKDETFKKVIEKSLGKKYAETRAEKEVLEGSPLPESQLRSVYRKMISEARKLEEAGKFKLPQKDVSLATSPAPAPKPAASTPAAEAAGAPPTTATPVAGSPNNASEDGGCPTIDTFAMEPPPPGLSGERFETYLKGLIKT